MELIGKDKRTQKILDGEIPRKFQHIEKHILKGLRRMQAATTPDDLRIPPGNKLKKLTGDSDHRYQINLDQHYRIRFDLNDAHQAIIEIDDFHD